MKLKDQGKGLSGLLFLSFFFAPMAANAEVNWYANINRALMHANDGYQKDTYFVDNNNLSSRAGITAETSVDPCLAIGGNIELEIASAASNKVSQLDRTNGNDLSIKLRQVDTWLKGDFGKLSLGHGSAASWTAVASDLSGTADTISYAGPSLTGGGLFFHNKASTTKVTGNEPTIGQVFDPYDGLGRVDRVRYDTPSFAGFSLSGSISNVSGNKTPSGDSQYGSDVAIRYAHDFSEVKVLGALSAAKFSKGSAAKRTKIWDGSLALLHVNTGLNAAVDVATAKPTVANDVKTKYYRFQIGKASDLIKYGSTNLIIDYAHSKSSCARDDKGRGYGIGVVQQLKKVNSEIYFVARRLKYKLANPTTTKFDNITTIMTGVRVSLGGKLS